MGVVQEFKSAVNTVHWRLENEPLEWGEPYRNLRQPHARLSLGLHWVLAVTYAVYADERTVWITQYRLLPNHPFGPGFDTCPEES